MNKLSVHVKFSKHIFSATEYQVLIVKTIKWMIGKTDKTSFLIAGPLPKLSKNEEIIIEGYFKFNPKYGEQFIVESWKRPIPKSRNQAINFLSSNIFRGIGKKTATSIVDKLGSEAIVLITENGVNALKQVPNLSTDKITQIVETTRKTFVLNDIMVFYAKYGITTDTILKAYARLSNGIVELKQNPFLLTQLNLTDFYTVDNIAKVMDILPHNFNRLETVLKIGLKEMGTRYGHCYVMENELIDKSIYMLNHRSSKVDWVHPNSFIGVMEQSKACYIENGYVYPTNIYYAEKEVAFYLHQLTIESDMTSQKEINNAIKDSSLVLTSEQHKAIHLLMKNNVLVLTGGPGTGKTYTINAIVNVFKALYPNKKLALTAPTGRAAKKIGEVTGLGKEALTMHRLTGYGQNGFEKPTYNETNQLDYDFIIVDEFSMADIELSRNLLRAIKKGSKLLIVGDSDQLPSVGPGNVLKDILATNIPQIRLTTIFRQAIGSKIIESAHRINKGKMIELTNSKEQYFIESKNPYYSNEVIVRSVKKFLEQGYSINEIMVLSPMKKGALGVEQLNIRIRDMYNPSQTKKKELEYLKQVYREGDKVMYLRNNKDMDIYNGDVGFIKKINLTNKTIYVDFDGTQVILEKDEWKYLQLSFCTTIHKSQGGQSPIVIMALSDEHEIMLTRNLFFTGITRAESIFVLVGTTNAIEQAISNNQVVSRKTGLTEKIMKYRAHLVLEHAI
ncbi:SF1B family DNA helicase RecD2 [Psychrobacillus sp. FSL H8-0487]|uniref:SF1B family DNA helicase RecD2 n=1 Tax=Psychrobacillus sp. FSL H8-0487 TaxID=2921391 RepID=UPI0030F8779B